MKSKIITNSIRTIKKSISRFISLFFMSFLGVFVYAGLQSLKPDMMVTLDKYLDEHNVYDIKVVSTLGLTEDDVNVLKNIDGIKNVEGNYSKDFVIKDADEDIVINLEVLPESINNLTLISGRLPNAKKEIVFEDNFIKKTTYNLNDKIIIDNEEYLIVGTVDSALYFSNDSLNQNRGTTTVGTGTINYYSYVLKDNFDIDYYTGIYVTVDGAIDLQTADGDYKDLVTKVANAIEDIKNDQEKKRYEKIYNEGLKEISDNEKKINKELNSAQNKLDESLKKLNSAKNDLEKLNEGIASYEVEINIYKEEMEKALKEYTLVLEQNNIKEDELESKINEIEKMTSLYPSDSNEAKYYQEILNNLNKLLETKETISREIKEYEKEEAKYLSLVDTYKKGLIEYQNGKSAYDKGLKDYNKNKQILETKIKDAKSSLESIKKPSWFINTRDNLEIYTSYVDDVNSVNNLAQVFPLIFFVVAIMVSLISMNRMVEEDRGEIGTLKSLGFSNFKIIIKYVIFSGFATIAGGFIGGILGITILPTIVFNIYGMLFNVPNLQLKFNLSIINISIFISVLCICGSTVITALKVLKEKPSELIRPKPPKIGKRIFLENFKYLWNHINFSNKVFIRNILRYKKRALVAILGIAGCSALLLCGFGIRDAIIDIADMQYKETFKYNLMLYINGEKELENDAIKDIVKVHNINVKVENISANLMIVPNDIDKVINLVDKNNRALSLEKDSVIITSKLARLNKLSVGDKIELISDDNKVYEYVIGGIANNYLMHYIYVLDETFTDEFKPNIALINLNEGTNIDEFNAYLNNQDSVLSTIYIEDLLKSADDMLKSLNKVVLIVICLAASLSFVVLYNLSTINIDERKREISTLKVLGFYDKEVDKYITKENILFTILGIILGLIFGYFLTSAVITTVEIEKASFIHHISLYSYIATTLITVVFTLLVNLVMHYKLKKIDMIASLKSVD